MKSVFQGQLYKVPSPVRRRSGEGYWLDSDANFVTGDILFYLSWGIWVFLRILQESTLMFDVPSQEMKFAYIACLVVVLVKELLSKERYGARDLLFASFAFLLAVSAIRCGDKNLLYAVIFIYSARRIPLKRVLKFTLFIIAATFFVIQILVFLELITEGMVGEGTVRERSSLGFSWPSRAPNLILTMSLLWVCLRGEHVTWLELLVVVLAGVAAYTMTDSRNPLACTLLLVVFTAILSKIRIGWRALWIASLFVLLGCLAFSLLSAICYSPDSSFFSWLNGVMSNRLLYSHNAFMYSDPSLFGNQLYQAIAFDADPLTIGYLDSSYLRLLFTYGIVALMIVVLAYMLLLRKACLGNNYILVGCLWVVLVHGVMEGQMISLIYTPFLFGLGEIICPRSVNHESV